MRIVWLRHKNIKLVFLCSIFAIVTHVFSSYYPVLSRGGVEDADLSVLQGVRIAIDPGHGGIDDGASRNQVLEKELNLAISLKLAEVLGAAGADVVLTREDDVDYYTKGKGGKRNDLLKRVELIQAAAPRLYLSIHANAVPSSRWSGSQVFYSPSIEENKALAEAVQAALRHFPPGNRRQAKPDSHILVLNQTGIPGILIETGYLSNSEEAAKLVNSQYQQDMAAMIAKGVAYHLRGYAAR
ncbi:MAG: N-acetylmuramoyl-L-alanine amidase [Sporomusaceae bacterium]|nr:N-acetylmuramoyl-L-alanine amidase [Sporomusaceae bacterium]